MLIAIGSPLPIWPYALPKKEDPIPRRASVVAKPKANAAALETDSLERIHFAQLFKTKPIVGFKHPFGLLTRRMGGTKGKAFKMQPSIAECTNNDQLQPFGTGRDIHLAASFFMQRFDRASMCNLQCCEG